MLKKPNKTQHKLVNEREKWNGRRIRKINCTLFTTKRPVCTYKERHSGAWWLSRDTFANPGGKVVWGALLCFTAWTLTAHEQISLSSQGHEPHCSSPINTRQQDVKNYFKDGKEYREMTTSLLNINFQVWGLPPRSFNLKKKSQYFSDNFSCTLLFLLLGHR